MIVYLPILTLEGVEGSCSGRWALTVIFALARVDDPVDDADAGAGEPACCRGGSTTASRCSVRLARRDALPPGAAASA